MEAPDKIYVSRPIYNQCGLVISKDKPVEYIKKDSLIEWLNGVKSDPMIPMNIDKVIDYIKAL